MGDEVQIQIGYTDLEYVGGIGVRMNIKMKSNRFSPPPSLNFQFSMLDIGYSFLPEDN